VCVCVVYLFYEFDKFWFAEKPADIMQFNVIKDKFVTRVTEQLQWPTAQLTLDSDVTSESSDDKLDDD